MLLCHLMSLFWHGLVYYFFLLLLSEGKFCKTCLYLQYDRFPLHAPLHMLFGVSCKKKKNQEVTHFFKELVVSL